MSGSKNAYQQDTDTSGSGTGPFVHLFCSSGAKVPATPPLAQKVKTPSTSWQSVTWQCLKFSINEPQFYAYQYIATGTGPLAQYTATAEGDLDGNGVTSRFELRGAGSSTGDAQRIALRIVNEDE